MVLLLQRVLEARVVVSGTDMASIGRGLLVFVGVENHDSEVTAAHLVQRMLGYRVFADAQGKMNLDVREVQEEVLLVPQFTLAADTGRGRRPGFSGAAPSALAEHLYTYLLKDACARYERVASGRFGADMQVALVNDGPVTFVLRASAGMGLPWRHPGQ